MQTTMMIFPDFRYFTFPQIKTINKIMMSIRRYALHLLAVAKVV